jgi:putative ABC transport system permease protein
VKTQSGEDISRVLAEVRKQLPDAVVYQPDEFARISQDYWIKRTGIGISFGAATGLGLMVGLMMVAQSLYALALDHIGDFATLKALGAEDRHVLRVILVQSLSIAAAGSIAGIAVVLTIRQLWSSPMAPVEIPGMLVGLAVLFVFGICVSASLFPYLRIRRIDPAVVLQG